MSQVFFQELDLPEPDYNLGVGSGSHGEQTGRML
jgi:UDP-N-acetylglucosamine 2-epimerase